VDQEDLALQALVIQKMLKLNTQTLMLSSQISKLVSSTLPTTVHQDQAQLHQVQPQLQAAQEEALVLASACAHLPQPLLSKLASAPAQPDALLPSLSSNEDFDLYHRLM